MSLESTLCVTILYKISNYQTIKIFYTALNKPVIFHWVQAKEFLPKLAICDVTCGASCGVGTNVSSPKSIRLPTAGAGWAETGAGTGAGAGDEAYNMLP